MTELRGWTDHELEDTGRLTEPMRYNPAADKYEPVSSELDVAEHGRHRQEDPVTVLLA